MRTIIRLSIVLMTATFFFSCGGSKESGQLIGVQKRPTWNAINPYGMVYVPSGSFTVGTGDQDLSMTMIQRPKTISIQGFFIDDTEITNNEYRQFVEWVKDSLAHDILGHYTTNETTGEEILDWEQEVDWSDFASLEELYYAENERFAGRVQINPEKLTYEYEWYDWKAAAFDKGQSNRTKFIKKEKLKSAKPDTMTWIRDFTYSYNEPMTRNYFWHPAFDNYPVVGVTWHQATAFSYWRTKLWGLGNEITTEDYRLPTEYEWEYAARGGNDYAPYPWGGYYVRNSKGCILANFKPGRGDYPEDGGFYTVKADAYFPNDYGIYNMAGNVSEWTSSAYYDNANSFIHDMNSDVRFDAAEDDPLAWKRKVIRGGSWKDIAFFIRTSTRHFEFQDTAKCYVGFRNALTFLGRSMNDFR